MASLLGGFQPLQRRLTKMYTDTKSSYDFVQEPVQVSEVPELSSLYRKLRIQKDRLISWGLDWSDTSESPDIDESLSKAGLGDVVGSVMSTIKEILAEVEPLWQSSRRSSDTSRVSEKAGGSKISLIVWDRSRFEDLLRDLTSSIDTLYDLSRTRQSARQLPSSKHSSSSSFHAKQAAAEAERMFESTRMKTPQQIDPASLITDPSDPKSTIEYSSLAGTFPVGLAGSRQIVYIRRHLSSNIPWKLDSPPPVVPVLLEYATYDPIFASTGVTPSMNRFEKLFAGLQIGEGTIRRPERGVLNLIGYFEEPSQAHFGLLYELPTRFSPDGSGPRDMAMPYAATLSDLLTDQLFEPPLEVKFRLACNLAMTVIDLHSKGIIHGHIAATNVVFFDQQSPGAEDVDALSKIDLRKAFLTSFDLFPDSPGRQIGAEDGGSDLYMYRSPLDPRVTQLTVLSHNSRSLDLYSLAMLLLEIGLWMSLSNIFPPHHGIPDDPSEVYKQVAARCGTKYLNAIKACWRAVDEELSTVSRPEVTMQKVYGRVLNALESCCVIDDGVDQEEAFEVNNPLSSILWGKHTEGPEGNTLNVSNSLTKVTEQQRAMDVLSNVIKTRDAHYRRKGTSPFREQLPKHTAQQATPPSLSRPSDVDSKNQNRRDNSKSLEVPSHDTSRTESLEKGDVEMIDSKAASPKVNVISSPRLITSPEPTASPKPKIRIYRSSKINQEHLDDWHNVLMPQINHALRGFYRKQPESVEISLECVGENAQKVKPTILVVCTSVGKVRNILKKSFIYDSTTYGLLVCKGRILRSRKDQPKRSMDHQITATSIGPLNKHYQEQPLNGASIGAYVDGRPLPPVSFGGLIMIDDKPYGLTVHHMLDDDGEDEEESHTLTPIHRSSDRVLQLPDDFFSRPLDESMSDDGYDIEISETGSNYSERSYYSDDDVSDSDDELQIKEPGDVEGIPEGCGAGYSVTQPAIDDVDPGFFPSKDAAEEDFLESFKLGEIYASSGLRRRYEQGIAHEIDWALFEFEEDRLPSCNHIKDGGRHCRSQLPYPVKVAPWSKLHDLEVHCMARTTGLQTGRILPGMSIVKIFGRQTPSQSYQVSGSLGLPGDSGAWLIDNEQGRACGHVLAWSSRKKVAYICPMEILLSDIAETLGARTVCFPSAAVVRMETLNDSEIPPETSIGQDPLLDSKSPQGLVTESLQSGFQKSARGVRFSVASDDGIVGAMDSMHINTSVISQG